MILRKPYALLIKHFKLIHVVFTLLSLFLFFRSNELLNFINEYIANTGFILENYRIKELLPFYINLIIVVFILLNIVVIVLLKNKGKSITFYIINIIIYVALLISFIYSGSVIEQMQIKIIDIRIIRALNDIFNVLNIAQIISMIMYAFRATGFDIKKFNFSKDLVELDIEEKDSEEVEVAVNIDINKIDRARRKSLRLIKYFYIEHKFLCNIFLGVLGIVLLAVMLFGLVNRNKTYNQNVYFDTSNYSIQVEDVFLTNKDKNGNIIDNDKSFIILGLKVKNRTKNDVLLNVGRIELVVNNISYYHKDSYKNYFEDFGTIYTNQQLSSDYKKYFLIYPINNEVVNQKMHLEYVDVNKTYNVNFNINDIRNDVTEEIIFNENKKFKNNILSGYELTINKYELADKIKINYVYTVGSSEKISAFEYIVPSISTNYDKAILRIDGTIKVNEDYNSYATNMEMLLNNFGFLKYVIDGKTYNSKFLGTLKSNKIKQENTVYLEINKDVLSADKISLIIKLRNQSYELILKDGEV